MILLSVFLVVFVLIGCATTSNNDNTVPTVTVNGRVVSQQVTGARPSGNTAHNVRIAWVVPNSDTEVFSIANYGDTPANIDGWVLRDIKNWSWKLDSLSPLPARTQRILYSDQRQLVNNTGDTLFLIAPSGEVHRFGFGATQRGDTVKAQ